MGTICCKTHTVQKQNGNNELCILVEVDENIYNNLKECPICLLGPDESSDLFIVTECGHQFHSKCFDMWYHKNPICPMCLRQL